MPVCKRHAWWICADSQDNLRLLPADASMLLHLQKRFEGIGASWACPVLANTPLHAHLRVHAVAGNRQGIGCACCLMTGCTVGTAHCQAQTVAALHAQRHGVAGFELCLVAVHIGNLLAGVKILKSSSADRHGWAWHMNCSTCVWYLVCEDVKWVGHHSQASLLEAANCIWARQVLSMLHSVPQSGTHLRACGIEGFCCPGKCCKDLIIGFVTNSMHSDLQTRMIPQLTAKDLARKDRQVIGKGCSRLSMHLHQHERSRDCRTGHRRKQWYVKSMMGIGKRPCGKAWLCQLVGHSVTSCMCHKWMISWRHQQRC